MCPSKDESATIKKRLQNEKEDHRNSARFCIAIACVIENENNCFDFRQTSQIVSRKPAVLKSSDKKGTKF